MAQAHIHQNASLYVGDLSPDVTEAMLFDVFKAVGPVLSIRVCRDAISRKSLGYAYVNFQNPNDAERAKETLNYHQIKGKNIRIMWVQRDPSLRKAGNGNIFIKNLHPSIDSQTLYDTFSQFGNILSCKLEPSKGYGYVHFETEEAAKVAVERVNGMLLKSLLVYVGQFVRANVRRQELDSKKTQEFTDVFIRDMKADITEEELRDFLKKQVGGDKDPIESVFLDHDKQHNRPWAIVNFVEHQIAVDVIEKLSGKTDTDIKKDDVPLYVVRHRTKFERQLGNKKIAKRTNNYSPSNLYVKNLDESINDQTLREAFSRFGEISSAKVMLDNKTPPQSKGFGFVDFKEVDSANKAIAEMSGFLLGSKPLYVNVAQPREVRRATLEIQYASRAGPRGVQPQVPGYGFPPQQVYPPPFFGAPAPGYFNVPGRAMIPPKGWPAGPGFPGAPIQGGPPGGLRGAGVPPGGRGGRGAPQQPGRGVGGRGPAPGRGAPKAAAGPPGAFFGQPPVDVKASPAPSDLISQLGRLGPQEQKNFLGEKLFNQITTIDSERAAKITGMLLEMDTAETISLLEGPRDNLVLKVNEAIEVLKAHEATGQ
eukprot:NODE_580_length_2575_cov_118.886623_g495_i0.p1 GENE.NODE_580_length_2575_cov_118.886623_g495_i0~~NODE_580_length_2575_cov_118.886623_g495_i0.p1  ORF type:complete len:594 (+),score=149.40 NODE_580_length_2575_cov_118.886623_g495_i0:63-1844(+)